MQTQRINSQIKRQGRTFKMPSLTIPDQVEPLSKLVSLYSQGRPVPTLNGHYDDFAELDRMDIHEQREYISNIRQTLDHTKTKAKELMQEAERTKKATKLESLKTMIKDLTKDTDSQSV